MPSDVLINRHMAKLGMAPQSVSWSDGPLTIDEVSQFFSLPIAEAAQKLSVCGSVLQRICKENGIARWPYRKVIAGKTIEEIKDEGLKEMAANPSAYKVAKKQPSSTPASKSNSNPQSGHDSASGVEQLDFVRPSLQPEAPSAQLRNSSTRIVSAAQAKTPVQGTVSQRRLNQQSTTPSMRSPAVAAGVSQNQTSQKQRAALTPSPDDFKFGFPSKGLSKASTRWWGNADKDPASAGKVTSDKDLDRGCSETSVEGVEGVSEMGVTTTASSLLVRTRRKASLRGRSSMAHAVIRGYGIHKLGIKDVATLRFVFGDNLPKHWTSAFPSVA